MYSRGVEGVRKGFLRELTLDLILECLLLEWGGKVVRKSIQAEKGINMSKARQA